MQGAGLHTFQVLTKRHDRLRSLLNGELDWMGSLSNVWWGVSVENREHGLPRIDSLRSTNARLRFLSIEPLLENLGKINLSGIDWVIVGGESGPHSRTMAAAWAERIRDQCLEARVPFFFKQWGGRSPKQLGRMLDSREWNGMPVSSISNPACPTPPREASRKRWTAGASRTDLDSRETQIPAEIRGSVHEGDGAEAVAGKVGTSGLYRSTIRPGAQHCSRDKRRIRWLAANRLEDQTRLRSSLLCGSESGKHSCSKEKGACPRC